MRWIEVDTPARGIKNDLKAASNACSQVPAAKSADLSEAAISVSSVANGGNVDNASGIIE
jgi:hypothetical protein